MLAHTMLLVPNTFPSSREALSSIPKGDILCLAARGGKGVFQAAHSVWFGTGRNENLPAKEVC